MSQIKTRYCVHGVNRDTLVGFLLSYLMDANEHRNNLLNIHLVPPTFDVDMI